MSDKPAITPITGDAFKVAQEFHAIVKQGQAKQEALEKEFKARNDILYAHTIAQLKILWIQMATLLGIDAEKSWQNPRYKFVYKFIEYGFAAIEERDVLPQNPFTAMMGGSMDMPDDPEDKGSIDPSKLN